VTVLSFGTFHKVHTSEKLAMTVGLLEQFFLQGNDTAFGVGSVGFDFG
jgi:hypothetical protein